MRTNEKLFDFQAEHSIMRRRVDVFMVRGDGKCWATGVTLQNGTAADEGRAVSPMLSLEYEEAQRLLDELLRAGVRPSKEIEGQGQLQALQAHLEDMRKLLFDRTMLTTAVRTYDTNAQLVAVEPGPNAGQRPF